MAKTLNELAKENFQYAYEKGFYDDESGIEEFGQLSLEAKELVLNNFAIDKLSEIVEEVCEAQKAIRKNKWANIKEFEKNGNYKICIKDTVESEIIDILKRTLGFAHRHSIDLDFFYEESTKFNETRPYRHEEKE